MFGKKYIEKQIADNTRRLTAQTHPPKWFVVFGIYDIKHATFEWRNDVNKITYNLIASNYAHVFNSLTTLKKLCAPRVHLSERTQYIIPYLVSIFNKQFKVVCQVHADKRVYAIATLDNPAKDTFKWDDFDAAMMHYRRYSNVGTGSKTKKQRRRPVTYYISLHK